MSSDETYRQSEFKPPSHPVKGPLMTDGGLEVQGHIPEEFKQAMQKRKQQQQQPQHAKTAPQSGPPNISATPDEPPATPVNPATSKGAPQFRPAPNLGAAMANKSDLQDLLE